MATQTTKRATQSTDSGNEATAGMAAAAGTLAEMHRQQLAAGAETLSILFRAAEAIQEGAADPPGGMRGKAEPESVIEDFDGIEESSAGNVDELAGRQVADVLQPAATVAA